MAPRRENSPQLSRHSTLHPNFKLTGRDKRRQTCQCERTADAWRAHCIHGGSRADHRRYAPRPPAACFSLRTGVLQPDTATAPMSNMNSRWQRPRAPGACVGVAATPCHEAAVVGFAPRQASGPSLPLAPCTRSRQDVPQVLFSHDHNNQDIESSIRMAHACHTCQTRMHATTSTGAPISPACALTAAAAIVSQLQNGNTCAAARHQMACGEAAASCRSPRQRFRQ